jgi:coenzyme F420 hydrogenase subunit delta
VLCIDAGTSVRDILFDLLLSEKKPRKLIIVDAADCPGVAPGEIREIDIDQIRPEKMSDYSLHQFPTTNMLKELKEHTAIEIRLFVVQVTALPDEVQVGLSEAVRAAVSEMCTRIMRELDLTTNERRVA